MEGVASVNAITLPVNAISVNFELVPICLWFESSGHYYCPVNENDQP